MKKFICYIDSLFSHVTPKDLTRGVKISTAVHIGILLLIVIMPLLIPHKYYRGFRPKVYTVQLLNLPGEIIGKPELKPQQTVKIPQPVTKPKTEIKKAPAQKKSEIIMPKTKPVKIQEEKSPTLEDKLSKRLKEIEKTEPVTSEKDWVEPKSRTQSAQSVITGPLGTSGALGVSGPSDFPFQYYIELIYNKICSCWSNPQMVLDKRYSAVISFTILKTGEVTNIHIKKSSGLNNFDESGTKAIELAKPFPQLPPGYQYPQLTVNVEFSIE